MRSLRWGLLLFLVLLAGWAKAAGISLLWEPSPDSNAVGYCIYYGTVGTVTPSRIDVGNVTNAPVSNLQPGLTYYFYCTAYDSARNESDPSNVINYTVPTSMTTNSPPYFGIVSNQVVTVGNLVTFTLWGSDLDVPPQVLTYSCDNLPTNATLNPVSGVFLWTPNYFQTGTNNLVTRVTDSGTPALSRTNIVQIVVLPPPPVNLRLIAN